MEREIIERLAIDQALGELDTDVATLFEAYLGEHAEARNWAHAMAQTCTQTRAAVNRKTRPNDASPCVARLPRSRTIAWQRWGHWAAVIGLSLIAGITVGWWTKPSASVSKTVVVRPQGTATRNHWQRTLNRSERGFWETKAVAMMQPRQSDITAAPDGDARLWDRYRPSTAKERSHE